MAGADQAPRRLNLLKAAERELSEAAYRLDLSKHWLHGLFAQAILGFALVRGQGLLVLRGTAAQAPRGLGAKSAPKPPANRAARRQAKPHATALPSGLFWIFVIVPH